MVVSRCPRVAWQSQTPICFAAVKKGLIHEREVRENTYLNEFASPQLFDKNKGFGLHSSHARRKTDVYRSWTNNSDWPCANAVLPSLLRALTSTPFWSSNFITSNWSPTKPGMNGSSAGMATARCNGVAPSSVRTRTSATTVNTVNRVSKRTALPDFLCE